jgi:hypothetical protein
VIRDFIDMSQAFVRAVQQHIIKDNRSGIPHLQQHPHTR